MDSARRQLARDLSSRYALEGDPRFASNCFISWIKWICSVQHMEHDWMHCVNRLLKAWTGYQLGVQMLSGGPETYQKAEWFAEVLADHVFNSQNQRVCNLTEWIGDILDNEFNLILEDNSIEWLASSLLKCHLWLRKCEKADLENFLSHLPSESAVQTAATESQAVLDNSDEECSDYEEPKHEIQKEQAKKPSRRCMETDEDGWTTVVRR